ncbi:MAG: class I SAM-dependent methyltransferase [Pseudobutyrivibrio sp.]|nr:class I SAM-dependent methyltransferase [Pseudobutyrivibrio sp.]
METYSGFALVYDKYMDNIPYDEWADNIKGFFDKYAMPNNLVCELGSGTGQITRRLKAMGYDMIGIDSSFDMLNEAMVHPDSEGILYLCQDMRQFELYGTVGAVVSLCDTINYLRDTDDLLTVCQLVNNYLDPSGLFIFDVKTRHFYQSLGDTTIVEHSDTGTCIWENSYQEESNDNEYYLTIYEENEEGTFDRYEEDHLQHGFSVEEISQAIKDSGLDLLEIIDADTGGKPSDTTDRLYFIAREVTK